VIIQKDNKRGIIEKRNTQCFSLLWLPSKKEVVEIEEKNVEVIKVNQPHTLQGETNRLKPPTAAESEKSQSKSDPRRPGWRPPFL